MPPKRPVQSEARRLAIISRNIVNQAERRIRVLETELKATREELETTKTRISDLEQARTTTR